MDTEWIILICVLGALAIVLITSYVCFLMTFYSQKKKRINAIVPDGEEYDVYREKISGWHKEVSSMPCQEVSIKTADGLTLRGRYYEFRKGATTEIMLHGYKGTSERDLSGGVIRCRELGHNVLLYDHRGSGKSDGSVITFGIKESQDLLLWIDYFIKNIDPEGKIIITGISMGAATVMMAASEQLPENVVGVLADCGYTSAKDIIKKVIRDMKLPPSIFYPFVKLGGLIFGGFNIDERSPIESMARCTLPVIFFHGDSDGFVPHEMSLRNYDACSSERKRMVTVEGADHGLAFPADEEKYLKEMREFFSYIETEEKKKNEL